MLILEAGALWILLAAIAVAGGYVRERRLPPRMGSLRAHQSETLALCALFAIIIGWFVSINSLSPKQGWQLGVFLLSATLTFECLAGHWVFKQSWSAIFADYNLRQGRLWPLVLVTETVVPFAVSVLLTTR